MVSAVSTPQPAASGDAASKAARDRQRIPESGCVGSQPVAVMMPCRARSTTRPRPPPGACCDGRIAMVISA
jgi:hypothetical protein